MMIIVAGTEPYDYDQYGKEFAHSFCSQLFRQKTAFAKYYPGPGAAVMQIAKWCNISYDEYTVKSASGPSSYPAAIVTANNIPIPIEAMFLLDPVVDDTSIDGVGIPSNVKRCYAMFCDDSCPKFNPP